MIDKKSWMDKTTKLHAHEKLNAMKANIGKKTFETKNLEELKALIANDNYVMNLLAIGNFFWKRVIQDMKKPKDIFTDETVNNAFYAPYANEIQINTGLLQDFGYNLDMPRPIIYGGCVGSTLGHELTHGFDDNGKKYGKHGVYVL